MYKEFVFNTLAIAFGVTMVFVAIGGSVYTAKSQQLKCIEQVTNMKYAAIEVNLICNKGN